MKTLLLKSLLKGQLYTKRLLLVRLLSGNVTIPYFLVQQSLQLLALVISNCNNSYCMTLQQQETVEKFERTRLSLKAFRVLRKQGVDIRKTSYENLSFGALTGLRRSHRP